MAASGERRMVFDTRGRRKHVIRVVYAILALLMGTSLFLVVGPVNIGELIGSSSTSSASAVLDEQAERIERRLAKDPTDETLLLALTRTKIAAGNTQVEADPETGRSVVTPEARIDLESGLQTWQRYLKQAGDEPSVSGAQLTASTYASLAESSPSLGEIESNLAAAAAAERIVAAARPSLGSLSTLAIYEYFNNDFAAGDKAAAQAERKAPSKAESKSVEKQLAEYRKRGKAWEKERQRIAKLQRAQGKEKLENPLGGFSGSTGSTFAP
jgi:hypothetical protein